MHFVLLIVFVLGSVDLLTSWLVLYLISFGLFVVDGLFSLWFECCDSFDVRGGFWVISVDSLV